MFLKLKKDFKRLHFGIGVLNFSQETNFSFFFSKLLFAEFFKIFLYCDHVINILHKMILIYLFI